MSIITFENTIYHKLQQHAQQVIDQVLEELLQRPITDQDREIISVKENKVCIGDLKMGDLSISTSSMGRIVIQFHPIPTIVVMKDQQYYESQ